MLSSKTKTKMGIIIRGKKYVEVATDMDTSITNF